MEFRTWCEQYGAKPWKAKQPEIAKYWQALPASMPIQPTNVIPANHRGSTHMYDGFRVTGSHQFINSVASRLKDMLNFDQGNTKLSLRYYQQVDKSEQPLPNSFVFYVQLRSKQDQ